MPQELTEDALYDLSDEELEQIVKQAKSGELEPENEIEVDTSDGSEEAQEETEEEMPSEPEEDNNDDDKNEEEEEEEVEQPEEEESSKEESPEEESEPKEETDNSDEKKQDDKQQQTEEKIDEDKILKQTFRVKANGKDFDFSVEELLRLAPKAMDYTRKTQEIAPWKKTISALKDQGLTHEDVNLLIDVYKGNKDAITQIIKKANIDLVDLDTESETDYRPNEYGKSDQELDIEEVVERISNDKEYDITARVINNVWDDRSREHFAKYPDDILVLHEDIKEGRFDDVAAIANKLKILDTGKPKSDVEYYIEAGNQYFQAQAQQQQAEQQQQIAKNNELLKTKEVVEQTKNRIKKQEDIKKKSIKRKNAALPKTAPKKDIIDYLDEDDDEEFEKWYKQLQDKY
jgi:hypothetical protein